MKLNIILIIVLWSKYSLVMIVNRNSQNLLCLFLSYNILVKEIPYLHRLKQIDLLILTADGLLIKFFLDSLSAE